MGSLRLESLQKHQLHAALQNHTNRGETPSRGWPGQRHIKHWIKSFCCRIYNIQSKLSSWFITFLTSSLYCTSSRSDFGEVVIQLIESPHKLWRTEPKKSSRTRHFGRILFWFWMCIFLFDIMNFCSFIINTVHMKNYSYFKNEVMIPKSSLWCNVWKLFPDILFRCVLINLDILTDWTRLNGVFSVHGFIKSNTLSKWHMSFKEAEIQTQTNQPTCVSEGGVWLCPSIRQRAIHPSLLVLPCHFYSKTHTRIHTFLHIHNTHGFAHHRSLKDTGLSRGLYVRAIAKCGANPFSSLFSA